MKKYLYNIFILLVLPFFVHAQQTILGRMASVGDGSYETGTATENTILEYAGKIVSVFLGMLGVIFIIIVISAGYTWMMAGGDSNKITQAKDKMWRAVIGLLIIVGAYAIQAYVFKNLLF